MIVPGKPMRVNWLSSVINYKTQSSKYYLLLGLFFFFSWRLLAWIKEQLEFLFSVLIGDQHEIVNLEKHPECIIQRVILFLLKYEKAALTTRLLLPQFEKYLSCFGIDAIQFFFPTWHYLHKIAFSLAMRDCLLPKTIIFKCCQWLTIL